MIPGWGQYPAYKDSGVPLLGEIPAHWSTRRQRACVQVLVSNVDKNMHEGELPVRLCNYLDVYRKGRITSRGGFMRATATREEVDRFRLRAGDVVVTKDSESWTDIGVPALVEYDAPDLVCGYHLALLRPRQGVVSGSFLFRVTQSREVAVQYHVGANGVTRYGLAQSAIEDVVLPIPPISEQHLIARFLDHVDRRISSCVRAEHKLIGLLREHGRVAIHRAVTSGLGRDMPCRPSGEIGPTDMPAHWDIAALGAVAAIQTGPFGSQLHANEYVDGGIPVVNPSHMHGARIIADPRVSVSAEKAGALERHRLRAGDIVAARRGELGRCALVVEGQEGWLCGTGSLRIRPRGEMLRPQYLVLLLGSPGVRDALSMSAIGSTMDNLSAAAMARLRVPIPPLMEQDATIERAAIEVASCEAAEHASQREVALLLEYRARLISDVVTGKIDARLAAAGLPDQTGGLGPFGDGETISGDVPGEDDGVPRSPAGDPGIADPDDTLEEADA